MWWWFTRQAVSTERSLEEEHEEEKEEASEEEYEEEHEGTPLIGTKRNGVKRRSLAGTASLYHDDDEDITPSRKIARFLSRFSWYYPRKDEMGMSLDDAWAYFEHSALARYLCDTEETTCNFSKASPGEKEEATKLYPIISTPETDLADFGIGVGVYFYTVRMLSYIMFAAGVLSLPNMFFYASSTYSSVHDFDWYSPLRSSAVCSDKTWKACPNCTISQLDYFPATFKRYAETASVQDGESKRTFILINDCGISSTAGLVCCITMIFIVLSLYALNYVSRNKEVEFDLAEQTSTDYSMMVTSPPKDAKDPQEWREFFQQFGDVVSLTIGLDNEDLLKKLLERRSLISSLEAIQPPGVNNVNEDIASAVQTALPIEWYWKLFGSQDAESIQKQIEDIDTLIENDLSKQEYHVSAVFVIFETEEAQQRALKSLQLPHYHVVSNNIAALPNDCVFRGQRVLNVREPPEPSSVRWQDLDESFLVLFLQRVLTFSITVVLIALGCAFVIYVRYKYGTVYGALAVSAVTSAAPSICPFIIDCESHPSEGSRQASLYFKITGFLWITTALLTAIITPFVDTLDEAPDSLIPAMYAIFITEMFVGPATQLIDPLGLIYRHVLGPRASNQKQMTYYFQGTMYDLSERYTNLTSVLFFTFYYAMLFPIGFFLASITLTIHYWTDKFCLLRVWAPNPMIGTRVAKMSRTYFLSTALVVYAFLNAYNYSSFPFDDACRSSSLVSDDYVGKFNSTTGSGDNIQIEIASGDHNYYYCNQNVVQYWPPGIRRPSDDWRTSEQDSFTPVFAFFSVVMVVAVVIMFVYNMSEQIRNFFVSPFQSHDKTINLKRFSEIPTIYAYVPGAKVEADPFPVLFCDVSGIDSGLIPWKDPGDPTYRSHNVIFDVPGLAEKPVFSTIYHWPGN